MPDTPSDPHSYADATGPQAETQELLDDAILERGLLNADALQVMSRLIHQCDMDALQLSRQLNDANDCD